MYWPPGTVYLFAQALYKTFTQLYDCSSEACGWLASMCVCVSLCAFVDVCLCACVDVCTCVRSWTISWRKCCLDAKEACTWINCYWSITVNQQNLNTNCFVVYFDCASLNSIKCSQQTIGNQLWRINKS